MPIHVPHPRRRESNTQGGAIDGGGGHGPADRQPHSYDPTRLPLYESLRRDSHSNRRCRRRGSAIRDVLEDCEAAERLRKNLLLENETSDDENLMLLSDRMGSDTKALSRSLREFLR